MLTTDLHSFIRGQAEVEKERKMDEEGKSKFSPKGLMDRRLTQPRIQTLRLCV